MEKILQAFSDIADVLPRLDRLKATFPEDINFNQVIGLIYSDILEFHRRAYRIFRRKAWHFWFAFDWGLFERRFKSILRNLEVHCDLLDKEAAAAHFSEMKQFRDKRQLEEDTFERQRQIQMAQDVFGWLSAEEDQQDEQLHRISDKRQPGTCDWILEDPQIRSWIEDDCGDAVWMTGIPGAGKTFLCSLLIQHLQSKQHLSSLHYLCGHQTSNESTSATILRTLAIQLLQQNLDMASLVHQAYLQKGSNRSGPAMKALLIKVLPTSKVARIVIDGMDELSYATQHEVLKSLVEIQKRVAHSCKVLVSSRNEPQIQKSLATQNHLKLTGQTAEGLNLYIKDRMRGVQENFPVMNAALIDLAEQQLSNKAKGMFLWVRLVTDMLNYQMSELEFETAINQLPEGLDEAYGRILSRIGSLRPIQHRQRAFSILYWVCAARRPISIHEVADGIVLHPGQTALNRRTRSTNTDRDIVELCAPLLESLANGVVDLVHFSAKEYLLHENSGPFIDMAQAHLSIALSCVINLTSCLDFVHGKANVLSEGELESRVVQGYYGLQSYGHEFWAEHVLAYLERAGDSDSVSRELIDTLKAFSPVWKHRHTGTLFSSPLRAVEASLSLNHLRNYPAVHGLITSWLHFKSELHKTRPTFDTLNSQEQWRLGKDETFLSLIDSRLSRLVERLLTIQSSQLPSHIDENDFKHFVGRYNFLCRYQGCNYQCRTIQERNIHEEFHILSFPCLQCDFAGRGFRSRKDLEKHMQRYHMSPEDFDIPDELHSGGEYVRGASNFTSRAFRMPSSRSGNWTERGRKDIQQVFEQVLTRLESEKAVATGDGRRLSSEDINSAEATGSRQSQNLNVIMPMSSLDVISQRVKEQSYGSLADFKDDISILASDPTMASGLAEKGGIESICEEELEKAMAVFPAFGNFDQKASARAIIVASSSNNAEQLQGCAQDHNEQRSDTETENSAPFGKRVPYWSQPEVKQFPELLERYGRDFASIAGQLKTKNSEEVAQHFLDHVRRGETQLSHSADLADARLQREAFKIGLTPIFGDAELEMRVPDDSAPENYHHFLKSSEALNAGSYIRNAIIHPPPIRSSMGRAETPEGNPERPIRKKRRPLPRALCPYCTIYKNGLRDEYALGRHIERFHTETRKVWICEDISVDKRFLAGCKSCSAKKRYKAKRNANKHLREKHFSTGTWTSAETVQRWIREVEEPNPKYRKPSANLEHKPSATLGNNPLMNPKQGEIISLPSIHHLLES